MNFIKYIKYKVAKLINMQKVYNLDERYQNVQAILSKASKIIDLGCGNNPTKGASVCVDLYIDPKERSFGYGEKIDVVKIKKNGIFFVNARIDSQLPFKDKEFEFAYSHHVFEHLNNPEVACKEMMRVAKSGVIITPSILSELLFGRDYHRWLVMQREDKILFFKKRKYENIPFGDHPKWNQKKGNWYSDKNTNPFDILLNEGDWYKGKKENINLAKILRNHWYSHSPLIEVIFIWKDILKYEIYE